MDIKSELERDKIVIHDVVAEDYNQWTNLEQCMAFMVHRQGTAKVEVNLSPVELPDEPWVCSMGNLDLFRVVELSENFRATVILISLSSMQDISFKLPFEFFDDIFSRERITITNSDYRVLLNDTLEQIRRLNNMQSGAYSYECKCMFLRSTLLLLHDMIMYSSHQGSSHQRVPYSQADAHFRGFIRLLVEHGKKEHEVRFYASKLAITDKYLNVITQAKTKHKAKDVISSFLIHAIKRDLVISGESIKTLAFEYNFADQSSFGKFFKKETGMSPRAFRQSQGIDVD